MFEEGAESPPGFPNPPVGFGPQRIVQHVPVWGASRLVTGASERDTSRVPRANPADANSSTMKGLQRLTGEFLGSRCQVGRQGSDRNANDGE